MNSYTHKLQVAKFHEVVKYIILYSKLKLLQPSSSLIENKKFSLKNYVIKTIFFQWYIKLFDWSEIEDSAWTWDKNVLT